MPHVRKQIRDRAVVELTGLATTGLNIFASRIRKFQDSELPGLRIHTRNEVSERADMDNNLHRKTELVIEAVAKQVDSIDDLLDTMAVEIETAIGQSNLNNLAIEAIELVSTNTEILDDANQPVGVATLVFTVQYFTIDNLPEATTH